MSHDDIISLFYSSVPEKWMYPLLVNGRVLCDEHMNLVLFKKKSKRGARCVKIDAVDWVVSTEFLRNYACEKGIELCEEKDNIAVIIVTLISSGLAGFTNMMSWMYGFLSEVHARFSYIRNGWWQHECLHTAARRDDFATVQILLDMGAQIEWLPGKLRFFTGVVCHVDNQTSYRWLCPIDEKVVKLPGFVCVEWNNFPEKAHMYTVETLTGEKMHCFDYNSAAFLKEQLGTETTFVTSHPYVTQELVLRDPNYIDRECYFEDYSVLIYAIETSNANMLQLLVKNNADVDALVENLPLVFYKPSREEYYNQYDKDMEGPLKYSFLFSYPTTSIAKRAIVSIIEKSLEHNKSTSLAM